MEYLLNLAFIDADFSKAEQEITEDIAQALKIEEMTILDLFQILKISIKIKRMKKL